MSDGWKFILILSTIVTIAFLLADAFVLGGAGDFMQAIKESGASIEIPRPFLYWNLRFISIIVGALFVSIMFFFIKKNW